MRRCLFFIFFIISVFSVTFISAESKQKEEITVEEPAYSVPQGVPRWIEVFSNLEKKSIDNILQFINKNTGLNCKLTEDSGARLSPGAGYDIYR